MSINERPKPCLTGKDAKWFSPIQPVVNGINESQNKRWRLAHMIDP
jgi:hypothetical protein